MKIIVILQNQYTLTKGEGMNLGRTFLNISIFLISLAATLQAQNNSRALPFNDREFGTHISKAHQTGHIPPAPVINLPGTTSLGLEGMYQQQFGNRSLHNIVADPTNPKVLHAAITFAQNITEDDTVGGKNFLPQLRVYYLYSADDGVTWSAPKPIDTARTSIPVLILIKRGTEYVPAISAVRNVADTNAPNFCSLYLEQGAPGEGNFKEFRTDRKTFYDSLRNINFPSIALSHDGKKIFMAAGIDTYNPITPQYIQFSTFTLSEDMKSATWSGWKSGPNAGTVETENNVGFAFPWSVSLQVSPSGKLGIMWLNRDYGGPDLSTYLSESADEGTTWPTTPRLVLAPVASQQTDPSGDTYFFTAFNNDFWYNGEQPEALLGGFYYNLDSNAGFYIPASGTIFYWNGAQTLPVDLISKYDDTEFGSSVVDGAWLSNWANNGPVDIQGLWNVMNATVARSTSDPKAFAVYFSGWQEGDVQDMDGQIDDGTFTQYPYWGIWRATTVDGGLTFFGPEAVRYNDLNDGSAQKYDYRGLETMMLNPDISVGTSLHIIFNVDSNAGVINYGGNPGIDNVTWLLQRTDWADVKDGSGYATSSAINYPNPFAVSTAIPITLTEPSRVTLEVSNQLGQELIQKDFGVLEGNSHEVNFKADGLGAGSYPYVLTIGTKKLTGILTIVK